MDPWIAEAAERIAARAPEELERLVAVSSPSGDIAGAEAAFDVAHLARARGRARGARAVLVGRSRRRPDPHAAGHGAAGRIVLLGHVDTVHSHDDHRALERDGEHLVGAGSVDMKGGDILALGVLRELALRPELFAEVALLLVCDEEWRAGDFVHADRFAGWDACLCFEGGELTPDGEDAVVVKRKAAGTLRVLAHGRKAHSGSAPEAGANALLALASAAQAVAAPPRPARRRAPDGRSDRRQLRRGVQRRARPPASCCATCAPTRWRHSTPCSPSCPSGSTACAWRARFLRRWPGMDSREPTAPLLAAAGERLGRPIIGAQRGGASDASYMAPQIPVTIDGLGPVRRAARTRRRSTSSRRRCARAPRSPWRSPRRFSPDATPNT